MFNFINMFSGYDVRKIAHYEDDDLLVDTCAVTDSAQPYETAVAHPAYGDGRIVIVEMYHTVKEAEDGYQRWIATMTADKLLDSLQDVSTATIASLCAAVAEDDSWRTFARQDVV